MSTAAQTKLFGVRIPVDPKLLLGGLAVLILVLFWYNSHSDDAPASSTTASNSRADGLTPMPVPVRARKPVSRRAVAMSDRSVLRLRPIDPSKGDIDPTLRLDLLARLQNLQPSAPGRSLFEGAESSAAVTVVPVRAPILMPRPKPTTQMTGGLGGPMGNGSAPISIPLKYYGYLMPSQLTKNPKAAVTPGSNRGFFLDGDNVLVASEGDLLKQRYLVVELTPGSARLEDTQARQGQTLPVVTAAQP